MLGPVPYWLLGYLSLGIVWVTALLCALASVGYARDLGKKARALRTRLREGRVTRGAGEGGALAAHTVDQLGRALDGEPPAMAFSDKAYRGEVFGGELEVSGEVVTVAPRAELEVWPEVARQASAASIAGDAEFDVLYKDSRGSKGSARAVTTRVVEGDRVFFATTGGADDSGKALTFLSLVDPLAFYAARRRAHVLFALAELLVCAGLTAVALRPPAFGPVSTVGGVALLAFFLLVQPLGVSVEEASREPFRAFLRGTHKRSAPFPGGVVPGRTTTQVSNG